MLYGRLGNQWLLLQIAFCADQVVNIGKELRRGNTYLWLLIRTWLIRGVGRFGGLLWKGIIICCLDFFVVSAFKFIRLRIFNLGNFHFLIDLLGHLLILDGLSIQIAILNIFTGSDYLSLGRVRGGAITDFEAERTAVLVEMAL